MIVKFTDYEHWVNWWNGAIPYPEPMEKQYLENIKNELPNLILYNTMWLAYNTGTMIQTARVTAFKVLDPHHTTIEVFDFATTSTLHIAWAFIVDYETEPASQHKTKLI